MQGNCRKGKELFFLECQLATKDAEVSKGCKSIDKYALSLEVNQDLREQKFHKFEMRPTFRR